MTTQTSLKQGMIDDIEELTNIHNKLDKIIPKISKIAIKNKCEAEITIILQELAKNQQTIARSLSSTINYLHEQQK